MLTFPASNIVSCWCLWQHVIQSVYNFWKSPGISYDLWSQGLITIVS